MSLKDLIDNNTTDKNTLHSYLETYETLFTNKRYTAKSILEIGVQFGGSIKLWNDYFINANIYGIDIMDINHKINDLDNSSSRINLYLNTDAYNLNVKILDKKFDIIIEDGDHLLVNQIKTLKKYLPLLEDDGILIIEDIQRIDDIIILTNETPDEYKKFIEVYDLRKNKNRWDDILFVINKNKRI